MKKIVLLSMFITISCFAIDIKITEDVFDNGQFVDFCTNNNEIYILAYDVTNKKEPVIHHFSNNQWKKIEFPIEDSYGNISFYSQIKVDSFGNLWISGYNYLYKYANGIWDYYYVDDKNKDYRAFLQFIIDKDNNIWVMSNVNNPKDDIYISEFFKFDGSEFGLVFTFNTHFAFYVRDGMGKASTITYTNDDKIIFQRTFNLQQENLTVDSSFNDIYILNTDKTYERIKSQNAILKETDIWDEMNQNISHLYSNNSNEIWTLFSKRMFSYPDNPEYTGFMGGGLSLYKDGEWILFDSTNNLTRYNELNYDEMGRMLDLKNGKYLLFGRMNCYLLDYNSTQLQKLEWSELLMNGEFIKFNNKLNADDIIRDFTLLAEKDNGYLYITEAKLFNNSIYLLFGRGLLILPLDNFTNVETFAKDEISIYPNPASEYIYVNSGKTHINSKVDIFNAIGVKVLSAELDKSDVINIRELPSGFYYVKINNNIEKLIINR